jgi:Bacterial archaeo-eukaryotic release factor family 3
MKDILHQMLNEKGQPCLSIILPTRKLSPEREQNQEIIHQGITKAKELLKASASWPIEKIKLIESKLNAQIEGIDPNHLEEGLGIFVSPNLAETVLFPFPVQEKIYLQNTFETRDVGYLHQLSEIFLVLTLTKKEVRLYKSSEHGLLEIENEDFPMEFVEEYEYAKPARGLSYSSASKGFVPDNSITKEMRFLIFLKALDSKIEKHVQYNRMLIVNGVREVISDFMKITKHNTSVAGKIIGHYKHVNPELDKMARHAFHEFRANKKQALIHSIHEHIGSRTAAIGLPEVWKNANEGKGLTLAVEKDFVCRGYVTPDHEEELHLSPPAGTYRIIHDAVDDVIEKVLEKKGEVIFVDDRDLSDMGHIAMTLRYS